MRDTKRAVFRVGVLAVLLGMVTVTGYAHPPKSPVLSYDAASGVLTVGLTHAVSNVNKHYVKSVEILLNDQSVVKKEYTSQPSEKEWTLTFDVGALKAGDKIKVKATCNIFGTGSAVLDLTQETLAQQKQKENTSMKTEEEEGPGPVQVGTEAPLFTLKDQDGTTVTLKEFRGKKNVVLVFYPGDQTPGCTKQLCAIRDDFEDFKAADTAVFGVNPADAQSHKAFIEKQKYPFPLLVDEKGEVAKAYNAKGLLFTKRTVYGIDKEGKIVFAQRGMPTDTEILAAFKP
ncbi:MAG TPA: peroxiredoxin [Candidatus Sumerlaeota bacterium]|nr:peroxiredoxin [Candidatus Sumerlaeota bacterium]